MRGLLIDTETGDLLVHRGSLQVGDTDGQTVELLLNTSPGEWKETPMLGADARRMLGGNTDPFWPLQTKKMIKACGVDVKSVSMAADGTITIK